MISRGPRGNQAATSVGSPRAEYRGRAHGRHRSGQRSVRRTVGFDVARSSFFVSSGHHGGIYAKRIPGEFERSNRRHSGVSRFEYAPCTTWPGTPSCMVRSSILDVLYSRSFESARAAVHAAGIGVTQKNVARFGLSRGERKGEADYRHGARMMAGSAFGAQEAVAILSPCSSCLPDVTRGCVSSRAPCSLRRRSVP